ncbi:uncharacterized protein METZ01_LOCUS516600 [marine metagenome]|uniref:Uncharacterized protein n=1 Tax=marine metagenome TaxID=408172 RepID=A0A383F3Q6_9ZZZZ
MCSKNFENITEQPHVQSPHFNWESKICSGRELGNGYFHQDNPLKHKKTGPQNVPFPIDLSYDRENLTQVHLITGNNHFRDCKIMLVGFLTVNVGSISNTPRTVVAKNPTFILLRVFQ